jgi:methionyl-tRNA formyltransferase
MAEMRILLLANNWVGWRIVQHLKENNEEIVGLVVHPSGKRKYGDEIIEVAKLDSACIFQGDQLRRPDVIQSIRQKKPDIGISALFGYILRRELLDSCPAGCINIHSALLPYNRGAFPNVWSIVEGTPAGVTIHYIDEGIDTGDIISQQEVVVEPTDTGATLYRKLQETAVVLFEATWPLIRSGRAPRIAQSKSNGTYHRVRDTDSIDEIDVGRTYKGRELIDIIRARTFPPYPGAYMRLGDRKVYLRLQLDDAAESATRSTDDDSLRS